MKLRDQLTCAVVYTCVVAPLPPLHAQTYVVHEIAPQPGIDAPTWAWSVNNDGVAFAYRTLEGGNSSEGVLYQDMQEIGVVPPDSLNPVPYVWPGAVSTIGGGIVVSTRRIVAGFSHVPWSFVSTLRNPADLFVLYVHNNSSMVADISSANPPISVGTTSTGEQYSAVVPWTISRAYRVVTDGQNNPIQDLGTLGGPFSTAEAINLNGRIVGASLSDPGPLRAFLWFNGSMTDLGTLGGPASWARDINDDNVIVGWADQANGTAQAFRWQNGQMAGLGTLGGDYSEARGINNVGTIVGMSFNADGWPRAFLHDGAQMIDLNTRISPASGWVLQYAQDINDSGVIVGWGRRNGKTRGFILEPTTIPDVPGDLNGDGIVGVADVLILLANWGRCAECDACPADLDGDCAVGVSDLLILLANWG